jgi:hypothetical protein
MSADQVDTTSRVDPIHHVPSRLLDPAQCPTPFVNSFDQYKAMWKESVEQPDKFFGNVSSLAGQEKSPSTPFSLYFNLTLTRFTHTDCDSSSV